LRFDDGDDGVPTAVTHCSSLYIFINTLNYKVL